ncbi:MAG TPA: cupin domain-containing protein [Acidimicrobiia bacterium]|jgi:mannose-6-phosphate isomerase-like protein (cupin superfamily)|nr:cupin domain-containing protein [Acidimicrobiia bacterium]
MSVIVVRGSVVRRAEGKQVWATNMRVERKGRGVFEFESPPGSEIALHVHKADDELHYLIEGTAAYRVGEDTLDAGPGSLIYLPARVPHSLQFGASGGRWLWITREDNEGLFDEPIVVPVSEPDAQQRALHVSEDLIIATFAKYGMDFLVAEGGND